MGRASTAPTRWRTSFRARSAGACAAPTSSSTSSPRTPSGEVHGRGGAHGEQHARVPVVAVEQQEEGGDQADPDRHQPRDSRERHAAILPTVDDPQRELPPADVPQRLVELSADARAAVLIDSSGDASAASGAADPEELAGWGAAALRGGERGGGGAPPP